MPKMTREPAVVFANQLRAARLAALADAEAFDGIIHVVERLGSYLSKERLADKNRPGGLHNYFEDVAKLAADSGLTVDTATSTGDVLIPFENLHHLVRIGRNDALHQGAFARDTLRPTRLNFQSFWRTH